MFYPQGECIKCGEKTSSHIVSVQEFLNKAANQSSRKYICYKHYEEYLDEHGLNAIIELGKGIYFNRAILIDGSYTKLGAYPRRLIARLDKTKQVSILKVRMFHASTFAQEEMYEYMATIMKDYKARKEVQDVLF